MRTVAQRINRERGREREIHRRKPKQNIQLKLLVAVIKTENAVIRVICTHHYKQQKQIEIFIRHTEANYAAVN